MTGCKIPGPQCVTRSKPIDSGTLVLQRSPSPQPVGSQPNAALPPRVVGAAAYHRAFPSLASLMGIYWYEESRPGDERETAAAVGDPVSWRKAYEIDVNTGSLTEMPIAIKPNQDFVRFATPFERDYSNILHPRFHTVPIVVRRGDEYEVVGYVATVSGAEIFAPTGVLPNSPDQMFAWGIPLFVAQEGGPLWAQVSNSEMRFTVLTRIDGGITKVLSEKATGFVESEFGPIFFIASAFTPLGLELVRSITNSIFTRQIPVVLEDLVLEGMTDEAAQSAAISSKTIVEIGAGDLRASIELAKGGGARVIAVDPVPAPSAAVAELEGLGGTFVKGTAESLPSGTADQVVQYFPWRIGGTGSHVSGGTYRVVGDAARPLKQGGTAAFVTEDLETAEYLAKQATSMGMRAELTNSTAAVAARGASGSGVPGFSGALKVYAVKIFK